MRAFTAMSSRLDSWLISEIIRKTSTGLLHWRKSHPTLSSFPPRPQDFDAEGNHVSYDFGRCINVFESAKYHGIYSIEQWGKPDSQYDYEEIADHMIAQILEHI